MDSRGNLAANNFLLPQVAPAQSQQPQAYDDGLSALQDIQHVKGQTGDYYNKVMGLKSFMHNAQNNLGIDVRVPDMSRPESVRLHQIYNTALADILAQGNLLHTSRATQMARENRGDIYAPGIDPNAQPADTLAYGQDVFARAAQPTVTEANNLTQQPSYDDQSYAQKLQEYEDKKAYYDDLIAKDPAKAEQYEYQKSILTPPAELIKTFAPPRTPQETTYDKKFKGDKANYDILLKRLVNLKHGFGSFEPSTKRAPSGELFEVNRDLYGQAYGDTGKVISHIERDPGIYTIKKSKDGKESLNVNTPGSTKIVFTDGEKRDINQVNITQFAQALGSKMGYDPSALTEYIQEKGLEGEFGKLKEESYLPNSEETLNERKNQLKIRGNKNALVKPIEDKIKEAFSVAKDDAGIFSGKTSIDIGLGKPANIESFKSIHFSKDPTYTYSITNIKDLIPPSVFTNKSGKIDTIAANAFYKKTEKVSDISALVKELVKILPVDDFKKIYDALGMDLPSTFQGASSGTEIDPTIQPTLQPTTSETVGQKALREYRERNK